MSVLDRLFGRAPQAQTQAQVDPNNQPFNPNGAPAPGAQTIQTVNLAGTNPNPNANVQSNTLIPNNNNTPVHLDPNTGKPLNSDPPMSKFGDVFTLTPSNSNTQQPSFNLDPEKFNATVAQMNFADGVFTPELSAQILKGGEEAVQALQLAMNQVGRKAFAKAAEFTTKATEFGFNESRKSIATDLPSQMRRQSATQSIYEAHPGLNNPATKPLVDTMTANFADKYPNATPAEIQGLLVEYFDGVGSLFTKPQTIQSARDQSKAAASDFSSFA